MKYLLDTNVLSEIRKGKRAHQAVRAWAEQQPLTSLAISVLTLLEIEIGIQRIARSDHDQADHLNAWLHQQIHPRFKERILLIDEAVIVQTAHLHVPDPAPERDALIAGTALAHRLIMVTRNTRDFARASNLKLFDPWANDWIH